MWKLSNTANVCKNFPTKQLWVKNFQQSSIFLGKFLDKELHILMEFCLKKNSEIGKEFCNKSAWTFVKNFPKSIKLPKFPCSNAATLQGFLGLWWLLNRISPVGQFGEKLQFPKRAMVWKSILSVYKPSKYIRNSTGSVF